MRRNARELIADAVVMISKLKGLAAREWTADAERWLSEYPRRREKMRSAATARWKRPKV
jgi:hypothetical protein